MEKIKTATQKGFDCGYLSVIPAPRWAYIRIYNTTIATVAEVFNNPAETARLEYGENILEGYTRLKNLKPEADCIRITLEKE